MKLVNSMPQFDELEFWQSYAKGYLASRHICRLITKKVNQKLQEHFAKRTCVNCINYSNSPKYGSMCDHLHFDFHSDNIKAESFSCAAFLSNVEIK